MTLYLQCLKGSRNWHFVIGNLVGCVLNLLYLLCLVGTYFASTERPSSIPIRIFATSHFLTLKGYYLSRRNLFSLMCVLASILFSNLCILMMILFSAQTNCCQWFVTTSSIHFSLGYGGTEKGIILRFSNDIRNLCCIQLFVSLGQCS